MTILWYQIKRRGQRVRLVGAVVLSLLIAWGIWWKFGASILERVCLSYWQHRCASYQVNEGEITFMPPPEEWIRLRDLQYGDLYYYPKGDREAVFFLHQLVTSEGNARIVYVHGFLDSFDDPLNPNETTFGLSLSSEILTPLSVVPSNIAVEHVEQYFSFSSATVRAFGGRAESKNPDAFYIPIQTDRGWGKLTAHLKVTSDRAVPDGVSTVEWSASGIDGITAGPR